MFAGLTWLLCCIYQFKNHNAFMVGLSAIISVLCFVCSVRKKVKTGKKEN